MFCTANANVTQILRDPDVPVPLSDPLPFPWGTIEGVWEARGGNFNALFSFEVQNMSDSTQVLKVAHLDPVTGNILSTGTGLLDVRAQ